MTMVIVMIGRAVMAMVVGLTVTGSAPRPARATPPAAKSAVRTVAYGGLHLPVPAGWPVYHLDAEPTRCVRFDRHAVYLGQAGPDQDCPARITGRTEAIHVEPIAPSARRQTRAVPDDLQAEIRLAQPGAGVMVTATYGANPGTVDRVVRAGRVAPYAPVRLPQRRVEADAGRYGATRRPPWATGRGFDTCAAPSLPAMWAWRRAYRIANIYIGGAARACGYGNLSRSWVRAVRRMGYRLIPTYVGLQAPCSGRHQKINPRKAFTQGWRSATDAVLRAKALGIGRRAPIYFDIEAYNSRRVWCRTAVLRFLHAWTRRIRGVGYTSGVYSSVASGIRDLGRARRISKPSTIWFAHWDRRVTLADHRLSRFWWRGHRRIKQHRGPHKERHGRYTINIDGDIVDGRVY
jgi:hypothetical protein